MPLILIMWPKRGALGLQPVKLKCENFFLTIGLLREQEVNNHLLSKYSLIWISSGAIQPLSPYLKLLILCLRQSTLFNIQFLKK